METDMNYDYEFGIQAGLNGDDFDVAFHRVPHYTRNIGAFCAGYAKGLNIRSTLNVL